MADKVPTYHEDLEKNANGTRTHVEQVDLDRLGETEGRSEERRVGKECA